MATVKIVRPFVGNGVEYKLGDIAVIPDKALPKLVGHVEVVTLQDRVGQSLVEVDRLGRPWPTRFMLDLPGDDRQRLRELEGQIDAAVIDNDVEALQCLLTDWRRLLLSKLN